jgi:hypothetical protein
MCSCNSEYYFTYEGTEYAFDTHGKAAAKRKALGAVGKAPIRARKKVTA